MYGLVFLFKCKKPKMACIFYRFLLEQLKLFLSLLRR